MTKGSFQRILDMVSSLWLVGMWVFVAWWVVSAGNSMKYVLFLRESKRLSLVVSWNGECYCNNLNFALHHWYSECDAISLSKEISVFLLDWLRFFALALRILHRISMLTSAEHCVSSSEVCDGYLHSYTMCKRMDLLYQSHKKVCASSLNFRILFEPCKTQLVPK